MTANNLSKCASCGKGYAPHRAYRNKTQACDGPNGYCAGVIDGEANLAEQTARADAAEALAHECEVENIDIRNQHATTREALAEAEAERDEAVELGIIHLRQRNEARVLAEEYRDKAVSGDWPFDPSTLPWESE